ncbi:DUF2272 domain-containing protein [Roseomonas marmotae]|uniref:DUF2272 domain-containing protein n=1 Tax=Roseomonas marmotae TaxID=2768161 RepID=A0ABS3KDS9_9PROT|nr:DUF2272 domain-containing protein [Roseomonas marmotae]MBO1075595.1 DUF2272 domain-containing protein [Roseomonas marmotae]QTI79457.1 DUF2272 domain-containing protein [Roseomonas marmotae]
MKPGIRALFHPASLALPLALLLAACATQPPPAAPTPPLPYPESARERMLGIALAEWQDWGRIVVEASAPRAATAGPGQESRLGNFPRVLAYWRAVEGEGRAAIDRNRSRYATVLAHPGAPGDVWGEPAWSAAFISYVMRNAGVDEREFRPSAAHAFYIDGLLADAAAFPAQAPFIPHDPGAYAPAPGDLVCADRSRRPLAGWRERLAEAGEFRPMHCDIVVASEAGAGGRVVRAVGGNVADAVTLSLFPADAAGRLLPRPAGQPAWFAVFENRLGRLPPFGAPPVAISMAMPPAAPAAPRALF